MKSIIYVKRQSFEVRLNSVISFVFVAFCQPRILRYSARDVTDLHYSRLGKRGHTTVRQAQSRFHCSYANAHLAIYVNCLKDESTDSRLPYPLAIISYS